MNTATTPITSESVEAWMRGQLAKAHELGNYAHIQVHLNASRACPDEPLRISIYLGEGYRTAEHPTIEDCFSELSETAPKSQADLKRDQAAMLIAEAEKLEAAGL